MTKIVIRWSARLLSALIVLFWGFLLIAHLLGDAGQSSRPLTPIDYVIVSAMALSVIGLGCLEMGVNRSTYYDRRRLGWSDVNWRVLVFPGTLIPIAAALFLFSWLIARRTRADEDRI